MNKKGFTLIELLAVIVILAIIALIATPIILNVIDTARKGAKESSALGYVDAVEKQVMMSKVNTSATSIDAGTYTVAQLKALGVQVKGEVPEDTSVITIGDKGQVTNAWITYKDSDYKVYYDGSEAVADPEDYVDSKGVKHNDVGTPAKAPLAMEVMCTGTSTCQAGNYVYLDPTDLTKTCNASNSVSTTGTKTGCMKWYVIKDNGNSIDVLLDHNTTAKVAWNSNGSNASMGEVATALTADTTGWTSGLNPRLITANEIAHIVGADSDSTIKWSSSKNYGTDDIENKSAWFYLDGGSNSDPTVYASGSNGWQKQVATSQGASNYKWLFDYTNGCTSYGCDTADSSTYGYWTSSPVSGYSNNAWYVDHSGSLYFYIVGIVNDIGVRPVITVPKSTFSS